MGQTVRLIPDIAEGYFAARGIERPKPLTAEVSERRKIEGFPIEGWDGRVIEGQSQFLGMYVILTRKLEDYNGAVVAYIFRDASKDENIFSGTCKAKDLK